MGCLWAASRPRFASSAWGNGWVRDHLVTCRRGAREGDARRPSPAPPGRRDGEGATRPVGGATGMSVLGSRGRAAGTRACAKPRLPRLEYDSNSMQPSGVIGAVLVLRHTSSSFTGLAVWALSAAAANRIDRNRRRPGIVLHCCDDAALNCGPVSYCSSSGSSRQHTEDCCQSRKSSRASIWLHPHQHWWHTEAHS